MCVSSVLAAQTTGIIVTFLLLSFGMKVEEKVLYLKQYFYVFFKYELKKLFAIFNIKPIKETTSAHRISTKQNLNRDHGKSTC